MCPQCLPLPLGVWRYAAVTYAEIGYCDFCEQQSNIVEKYKVYLRKQDFTRFKKFLKKEQLFLHRLDGTTTYRVGFRVSKKLEKKN